jgi:hypothetical protein
MSLLKANGVQFGQSGTATNNLTLSVPSSPDGTIKLARGNSGATTADVVNIDSSGKVGIGVTSPISTIHAKQATPVSKITLEDLSTNRVGQIGGGSDGNGGFLSFLIGNNGGSITEALRIDSSGNLLVGTTDNSPSGAVGIKLNYNTTNPYIGIVSDLSANSTNYHLYNRNATNNGYRFYVNLNGGITNFSANNTNLSDERLKTNIEIAGNYLDKICSIPVRTFNYKDQGEDTEKTIGVIAQEVESQIPELVNNDGFGETPEDGIPLKTIYQTDLQYVLMRCIQEQQVIINELKTKVSALEAA